MNGAWRFLSERKYPPLILAGSGAVCLVLALVLVILFRGPASSPGSENAAADEFVTEGQAVYETYEAHKDVPQFEVDESSAPPAWVVYVTGEVISPGVYEMPPGGRINDAIRMAGGFTVLADREAVNLAEEAEDGIHIRVPRKTVEMSGQSASQGENAKDAKNSAQISYVKRPSRGEKTAASSSRVDARASGMSEKIDVNNADLNELQKLSGIGPVLARAIVTYRETNGPFIETEDLIKVKGIGRKRFESIRDFVTVSR